MLLQKLKIANKIKTRIQLKPDSPEHWINPPGHRIGYYNYDIDLPDTIKPEKPVQLDADTVLRYIEDGLDVHLYQYQKEILRKFISARNEGKEFIFRPARQNGITILRNYMILINALYDE